MKNVHKGAPLWPHDTRIFYFWVPQTRKIMKNMTKYEKKEKTTKNVKNVKIKKNMKNVKKT